MKLWKSEEAERLIAYKARAKKSDAAVLIFPGGAYAFLADHEGRGYAEFLNEHGYDAFVCLYRTAPYRYPLPLLDARRAVRLLRAHAKELEIDPRRIAVMGSSAGGNLAALLSTHPGNIEGEGVDEIDKQPFLPDLQILCYPVISLVDDAVTHAESRANLLGSDRALYAALSPETHVTVQTPPAFLWHTADDPGVPSLNTLIYAQALTKAGVSCETHVFPHGDHGLGLAQDDPAVGVWTDLLLARLGRF